MDTYPDHLTCKRHNKLLEACCECLRNASKEELNRFKLAVEYATDHIIMTDPTGVIVYANIAATKVTGYSAEEMMGKTPALWGRQMDATYYKKMWETISVKKEQYFGEVRNMRKGGVLYDAEVHIAPVVDTQGSIQFYVGIERDITELKKLSRAKTEFISLASHNLKTPLSSMSWYTEMLLNQDVGPINEKQRDYLHEIARASKVMTQLVSSLLNISRIDLGTFTFAVDACSVPEIIDRVTSEFRVAALERGVTWETVFEPVLGSVHTDCVMFENMIRNVLSNAIKYSRQGGVIRIKAFYKKANEEVYGKRFDEDRAVIAVRDDGIGIPAAEQQRVFSQFFRATNTLDVASGGTGLGMYLVHSSMGALGGDVWFSSEEGKGSEFYLALPFTSVKQQKS